MARPIPVTFVTGASAASGPFEPLPLTVVGGIPGSDLPEGTPRQIIGFGDDGVAVAMEFTPDQWSEFPEGAPTEGDWVAVAQWTHPEAPSMGFVRCSVEAEETTIPQRGSEGRLAVGAPVSTDDATTKEYVDSIIAGLVARIVALETV